MFKKKMLTPNLATFTIITIFLSYEDKKMPEDKRPAKPNNTQRMGTDPILPLIIKMSLPAMFSMMIQSLYNIVDGIYVAQLSKTALNAVSLVHPAQMIIISVNVGTGIGVSSLISRRLGQNRLKDAENAVAHGMIIANLEWILFCLIGLFASVAFCRLFTQDATLIDLGSTYFRIVMIGSIFTFNAGAGEKIMQGCGNMLYTMCCQLIGAVTNIILDPIMIFGKFGLPAMGVAGAAYATIIGQLFAMIATYLFMWHGHFPIKISFKGFRFHGQTIKDIFAVGFPSIIVQSIMSFTTMILNKVLIGFSDTAVGILGVYFKLQSFLFMPIFGMNQGVMPIMGYNYGAKNKKRLLETYKDALMIAAGILLVGMIVFKLFPDTLLSIFSADEEMYVLGRQCLRTISWGFIFASFTIISGTLFQATAHGFNSLLTTAMRQVIVLIPLAIILSKTMGIDGVWIAFPVSEFVSTCFCIFLVRKVYNKDIRNLDAPQDTQDPNQNEA